MTIIGIAGCAQAGKDTVADLLHDHTGERIVHFADALRDLAEKLDPLISEPPFDGVMAWPKPLSHFARTHDYAWIKEYTNYRDVLVRLGAGAREAISPRVWISALDERTESWTGFLVADVRYANEANWVKACGGEVWYVIRPGFDAANEEEESSLRAIRTLGLVDTWVPNDRDLDALAVNVAQLWRGGQ